MLKGLKKLLILTLSLCALNAQAQVKLNFDLADRGQKVTDDHYGIFYEEINHAGDGGLYAELVRNRSFEEDMNSPLAWTTTGNASMSLISDGMLNIVQKRALRVDITGASGGVRNEGYWGINIVNGRYYSLSFWMRAESTYEGTITVELQDADGNGCGRVRIPVDATTEWQKYTANIKGTKNVTRGYLTVKGSKKGVIVLDVVSLFPPTFKDRKNGCRPDLAQMLADLHPRFMRFPGGCYVEGAYGDGLTNRFEWKNTIGPIEERPGHMNRNWWYKVTDGQGYHEYLELAEDLGANAMFVVNMGIGHDWRVDENDIDPFIQEALDAIEYANGSTDTYWGKKRAENGHPEPFNLKYMEIGNEQEFMLDRDAYMRRYMQFYRAIKTRWPDIHLIANSYYFNNVTEPVELKDEHYYSSPDWFIGQYERYDNQPSSVTKIYVGEYAVTQNFGNVGNMNAALGEAVFMQGCENNSEAVTMMSYAPIFTHEENFNWRPDMIRFNSSISYGTPSYHVQKLFSNNIGKQNIHWTEADNVANFDADHGTIGLGTWLTSATFTDLSVTTADGTFTAASTTAADWTTHRGTWTIADGTFTQTNTSDDNVRCILNRTLNIADVDMTVHATKNGGSEGFLIIFDYIDENNYAWLNLGGWVNGKHGVEQCKNGTKTLISEKVGTLQTNHDYTIRVVKEGLHVRCWLDDELIIDCQLNPYNNRQLYTCANIDDEEGLLYVKLVNPTSTAAPALLSLTNGSAVSAEAEVLSARYGTDENTTSNPSYIKSRTQTVSINDDGTIAFECPAFSANVLRIRVDDVVMPIVERIPEPRLSYSFENGTKDDTGNYEGTLFGNATIETLSDGNHVLATGKQGEGSYMTIPVEAVQRVLNDSTDYTISLNLLLRVDNNTSRYCWGYAMSNGTNQYIGLVNTGGNGNWYYEIKDGSNVPVYSDAGLSVGDWHNITYTQKKTEGRIYIDGHLRRTRTVDLKPSQFINNITEASLGHSPYSADAVMENTLFDDFKIYDKALSEAQITSISNAVTSMQYEDRYAGIADFQDLEMLVKEVKNYVDDTDNEDLQTAYNEASLAVNSSDKALKLQRYEELVAAVAAYQQQEFDKVSRGEAANLTFLITNSSFTRYNIGWEGTDLTAIYNGYGDEVAEKFSCPFDVWQEISGLPAGLYTLTADAFYRAGGIEAAYAAWQNDDPTTQYAELYMNDAFSPLQNLYSSDEYTYDPYNYPDNLGQAARAFNQQEQYDANTVSVILNEGETLRLGIRKLMTVAADWAAYDHFQLHYEGTATGIVTPTQNVAPGIIYDLMGRRVKSPTRGIYIVDGRKFLIK